MGFLSKFFGFRWSLYILQNGNQLAYAEMQNGANDTMFHYSGEQRQQTYQAFEVGLVERCAEEECRLRFKAYVSRRYGLKVPFK